MTMTTNEIVGLYKVLSDAKLAKVEEADKYSVIKILRKLRPTAESFEAYQKDAQERLKPENWDDIVSKVQQWQNEGENTTLTEDERKDINMAIMTYERSVSSCIYEELNMEVEIEFKKLTESAYKKLLASNDWDAKTALLVADAIVEEEVEVAETEEVKE